MIDYQNIIRQKELVTVIPQLQPNRNMRHSSQRSEDGDLYQRATEDSKRTANFLYQSSVGLLSSGLTFLVGLGYLALVKWYLAPVYGAMWFCIFALQFWLSKSADAAMSEVFAKNAEIGEQFRGLYSRFGLIRAYNCESKAQKSLEEGIKGYAAAAKEVWARRSLLTFSMSVLAFLPVFVMFVLASYLTGIGQITIAELVSVVVLLVTVDSGMSQMPTLCRENATPSQLDRAFHTAVVDFVPKEAESRNASALSGGQQRRVEIARALLKGGEIFLFDEITSELDADTTNRLLTGLAQETAGKTVVFVSHDWEEIRRAGRVLVVDQGKIVQDGQTESLLQSEGPFRELFFSEVIHHG